MSSPGLSIIDGDYPPSSVEPPIDLIDHTQSAVPFRNEQGGEDSWAVNVLVDDYTIVGDPDKAGSYVVWKINVELKADLVPGDSQPNPSAVSTGRYVEAHKRYSEFTAFRDKLIARYPELTAAIPELPPKSVVGKFRPAFLEKRRKGLEWFLSCVMLNPQLCNTPVVRSWYFGEKCKSSVNDV